MPRAWSSPRVSGASWRPLALACLLLSEVELALDRRGLVQDLEALLEDLDRLVRTADEPQRPAQVVERVRVVQIGRAGRERLDRLLEHRDGGGVVAPVHQVEALAVQLRAARRVVRRALVARRGRGRGGGAA